MNSKRKVGRPKRFLYELDLEEVFLFVIKQVLVYAVRRVQEFKILDGNCLMIEHHGRQSFSLLMDEGIVRLVIQHPDFSSTEEAWGVFASATSTRTNLPLEEFGGVIIQRVKATIEHFVIRRQKELVVQYDKAPDSL